MLSNNPVNDKFLLTFSDDFFIPSICEKYNKLLSQKRYPLLSIQDMVQESIQTFEGPSFAFEPNEQQVKDSNGASTTTNTTAKSSIQNLASQKRFSVNFRHTDGFLTYFCLFEHYLKRYSLGKENPTSRKPFNSVTLTTFSRLSVPMCRVMYAQCLMLDMPPLLQSYSNIERNFSEYSITFSYNTLSTSVDIPEPNI